ncbi:MAG: AAA family ATPase [Methanomassiliicoccaceae archaeon]|jgi:predicted cytidylate kinase|nr:AAA family ATPase [Methanomassiliicoccaceae archaeon]
MRITISGPPGSGKTTVCNKLSSVLSLDAVVFGKIFRDIAAERGLTLSELGEMAENDPSVDELIDSRILQIATDNDNMILESRLSAYMLTRNKIPAFRIYLDASPDVRAARIGTRDNETAEQARKATEEREASEERRYMMYYGIDIRDTSVYDLIVNTDDIDPDRVVEKIIMALEAKGCL